MKFSITKPLAMLVDPDQLYVRRMGPSHMASVLKVERSSFPTPWSRPLFEAFLANPSGSVFLLMHAAREAEAEVIGYLCLSLSEESAHILKLAVHPHYRRQGAARRLLHYALNYASRQAVLKAELEVREGNLAAQCLYGTLGFRRNGARPHYYQDTNEHAFVYYLDLPTFFLKKHSAE